MSKGSKKILKVSLFIYILVELLAVLKLFNIDGLDKITSFSSIYIPITTIILLIYAAGKGIENESICKIGITFIVISIIIKILNILGVISPYYTAGKTLDKTVYIIGVIANGGLSICSLLALFGIIPSNDQDGYSKFKSLAVLCTVVYIIMNLVELFVSVKSTKWLYISSSILSRVATIAEYSFIILYLLHKNAEILTEEELLESMTMLSHENAQQPPMTYNQAIQQQVPNQPSMVAPVQQTTQPIVEAPAVEVPVVQQQVVLGPLPQQQVALGPAPQQQVVLGPVPQQQIAPEPVTQQQVVLGPLPQQQAATEPMAQQQVVLGPAPQQQVAQEPMAQQQVVPASVTQQQVAPAPVTQQQVVPAPAAQQQVAPAPVTQPVIQTNIQQTNTNNS